MKIYLAGGGGRPYVYERGIFEAIPGGSDISPTDDPKYPWRDFDETLVSRVNMLESFYYIKPWQTELIPKLKSFMLDSGGFSFLYGKESKGNNIDWDDYIKRYARYVVENNVELFLELDIDSMVGYDQVKRYREQLETYVGRQCVPVWHVERGLEDYFQTCKDYPYIAVGGIAVRDGRKSLEPYLPKLVREAHKRGAKVHGLGYTNLKNLPHMGLDSSDSTAWVYGNRGGYIYQFDGKTLQKKEAGKGQRLNAREAARHNFLEWVRYAETLE